MTQENTIRLLPVSFKYAKHARAQITFFIFIFPRGLQCGNFAFILYNLAGRMGVARSEMIISVIFYSWLICTLALKNGFFTLRIKKENQWGKWK